MAPRETENNAYSKFWGDKQRALWYVLLFFLLVNERIQANNNNNKKGCSNYIQAMLWLESTLQLS